LLRVFFFWLSFSVVFQVFVLPERPRFL